MPDLIDEIEVFHQLKDINDPEHPYSLEQLDIVSIDDTRVHHEARRIQVFFTPTVPHCSMATLIGLAICMKLQHSLAGSYKTNVFVYPGSHSSELAVNRQLNDKERVAAALENKSLLEKVNLCLHGKPAL
mmetsp:Transcript_3584/g.16401  ORF Transcript_3584/g.16401 Transcript_3584/m.16401 type:complete len:130 (+) Transcript_3584:386-775(+)